MEYELSAEEARVLGSLIEKELSTPEYYPLSLNALVNACNQKTNRDPVVSYDEKTVARALESLRSKQLVYESGGARVAKYGQNFTRHRHMVNPEAAVVCGLLLRGPQTVGELRSRTERMHKFGGTDEVEETLKELKEAGLVELLARQPGRKESRYAHLLSGEPTVQEQAAPGRPDHAVLEVRSENDRIAALEEDLLSLREELNELKRAFLDFKGQFE